MIGELTDSFMYLKGIRRRISCNVKVRFLKRQQVYIFNVNILYYTL